MELFYYDHRLPATEIEKIQNDAEKFAEERFKEFAEQAAEFFASGQSFDDFFGDLPDDEWAEFEYDEFDFETIHQAYPEDSPKPLPQPFADELDEFAKDCFISHLEKLMATLEPRCESNAGGGRVIHPPLERRRI